MKLLRVFLLSVLVTLPLALTACTKPAGSTESATPSAAATADPEEDFLAGVRKESGTELAADAKAVVPGVPKIELQTNHYDMGIIPGTEIAVQSMKIYNRGSAPLKISRVQTSCGCTTGEMENTLIPPGGESRLIIRVDPKKIAGFQTTKILTIHNTDPENPNPTIDVTTTVAPELEVDPEVMDFGQIPMGQAFKHTLRVRQLQDAPLEVSGAAFQRDLPFLKSSFAPVPESEWRTPGKHEYTVTVEVSADAPAGELNELFIISSNVPRMPQFSMRLKGTIVGPFTFTPATVTLRGAQTGAPIQNVLSLTGKEAVKILEVANSNPAIQVAHRPGTDPNTVLFDLTVPQPSTSLTLRDTWRIVFETGGVREEQQIPVVVVLAREN